MNRVEAKQKWGHTTAYQEYEKKTVGYTQGQWQEINDGLNAVFAAFAACMADGCTPDTPKAQELVQTLQHHITEHYYTCTDVILAGLGQMYVCDERFKENIDKHSAGTAEFVSQAIDVYCGK